MTVQGAGDLARHHSESLYLPGTSDRPQVKPEVSKWRNKAAGAHGALCLWKSLRIKPTTWSHWMTSTLLDWHTDAHVANPRGFEELPQRTGFTTVSVDKSPHATTYLFLPPNITLFPPQSTARSTQPFNSPVC